MTTVITATTTTAPTKMIKKNKNNWEKYRIYVFI